MQPGAALVDSRLALDWHGRSGCRCCIYHAAAPAANGVCCHVWGWLQQDLQKLEAYMARVAGCALAGALAVCLSRHDGMHWELWLQSAHLGCMWVISGPRSSTGKLPTLKGVECPSCVLPCGVQWCLLGQQ